MTSVEASRQDTVEVFWRPGCSFCSALRRDLERRQVPSTWRNIWTDETAREFVRQVNIGNETVPTVRVGEVTLTNPTGAEVARMLGGDATAEDARILPGPQRRAGSVGWLLSWVPTIGLVVASEVLARQGLSSAGWVLDALAVASWWLTRPLRRR
jgi:mycoredoxin